MSKWLSFADRQAEELAHVEQALTVRLPIGDERYAVLLESMRYSLLGGGKRFRALLLLYSARMFALPRECVMDYAIALEMIHAYSLIHDDLPCMDDDDMRRGKPSNHIVYGVGIATLAGDALLNTAMEILLENSLAGREACEASLYMARAAGVRGMIGGQTIDLSQAGNHAERDENLLLEMVELKTSALFRAALVVPAILAKVDEATIATIENLAIILGRFFQGQDDLLDLTASTNVLGKSTGKDERDDKFTAISFYGKETLENNLEQLEREIHSHFDALSRRGYVTDDIMMLCTMIFERAY